MGIPGLLKEIGKGDRVSLTKLAIDHLEKTNRPLRIAIDAAIWNFQHVAAQGGKNPALRTFFFRLLKILALPIYPVFVYDGSNKPLTKRGKTVGRYGTCLENEKAKRLLSHFSFPHHTAPGEAEAECAFLQKHGVVDAVMSQDVDAIMFGSTTVLRDWSKEGTRGNKTPTHVNLLDANRIKERSRLDPDGMILVALLSGGDYDDGVNGFGPGLACEIAQAGFGADLMDLVRQGDSQGIQEWKERLEYELQTNESGHFKRRHLRLKLPDDFPNMQLVNYYVHPAISTTEALPGYEDDWLKLWHGELDVLSLRQYASTTLDWKWRSGARRFVRCLAQPLFQHQLLRRLVDTSAFSVDNITDERKHFTNDGILELRFNAIPADVVRINIEAEEENPDYVSGEADGVTPDTDDVGEHESPTDPNQTSHESSASKSSNAPWNPYQVERWWIPATVLKMGLDAVVEEWEQKQRDIFADPKKFATRKCVGHRRAPVQLDARMKSGAIEKYLGGSSALAEDNLKVDTRTAVKVGNPTRTLQQPSLRREPTKSRSITQFFKSGKNSLADHIPDQTSETSRKSKQVVSRKPHNHHSDSFEVANSEMSGTQWSRQEEELPATVARLQHNFIPDYSPQSPKPRNEESMTVLPKAKVPNHAAPVQPVLKFISLGMEKDTDTGQQTRVTNGSPLDKPTSTKINAVLRTSLSGTWKAAEADALPSKRAPRVSYVDLTSD